MGPGRGECDLVALHRQDMFWRMRQAVRAKILMALVVALLSSGAVACQSGGSVSYTYPSSRGGGP